MYLSVIICAVCKISDITLQWLVRHYKVASTMNFMFCLLYALFVVSTLYFSFVTSSKAVTLYVVSAFSCLCLSTAECKQPQNTARANVC